MDYLNKAIDSIEGNLEEALKELEELENAEHKEEVGDVCTKLRDIIAELKAIS